MTAVQQKDLYALFGVQEEAATEEIRKAYRKLAHQYHPDKTGGDSVAEEKLKEINAAYDVLKNPEKRREYDHERAFVSGAGFSSVGEGFGAAGFEDLFGTMFRQARPALRRGADLEARAEVTLGEVLRGVTKTLRLRRLESCDTCSATGTTPGTKPVPCDHCGGSGTQARGSAGFRIASTCKRCRGTGEVILDPCTACHGMGRKSMVRSVEVEIPTGVNDGLRLRLAGQGDAGDPGAPPGDLFIYVLTKDDPFFVRDGADVICEVPITFTNAALGATIQVPTLEGIAELRVDAGTQNATVLRMRGIGLPGPMNKSRGDQRVRIFVEIPSHLNREQKKLLKTFAGGSEPKNYPLKQKFLDGIDAIRKRLGI